MQMGQIVISIAGRDKCMYFIVLGVTGDYVYLADGKHRRIHAPKKKKLKHIQKTNIVLPEIAQKLQSGFLMDSDIRKAIRTYVVTKREELNLV